ncbi:S41 family peptidase [Fervidibacillus halotolerans]|uniref:S41 family peptidase n=1 Tax=Fervidibacillus halotolerans TaxID=2980027 RepID=A0A9E8RXP5_9BACI|nr:S41 family peptidase [Fervidibacillus halotolerans]WAA12001.1 S41 family peptidase [Fervidibacillus halotolerans]
MKKRTLILLWICSIILSSVGTYFGIQMLDSKADLIRKRNSVDLSKVEKVFQMIIQSYVEDVDENTLIEGAIDGMLDQLHDPYSVYLNKEQAKEFHRSLESTFEGIGAEISEVDGKIVIISPLKNSPAERAGLKPYDEIMKVDGKAIKDMDVYDVMMMIRGEKGTTVSLQIMREGFREPLTIEVVRDRIPIETVFSKIIEHHKKSIGYIEITSFSTETGKDFAHHLHVLERENIDGLIIDVRGNPGGLLSTVEEIVQHIVTNQKPFVQIEGKNGKREPLYTKRSEKKPYPMVVLMDKGSASASEILAAALKEGEGIPSIGERTFGKGTVQQQIELGDETFMKLTMYKWLTPDGRWIHGKGIEPDIEVQQSNLFHLHPIQVDRPLERDMNNVQVKYAQELLKAIGFDPGRMDGYFNEKTEEAVKQFQEVNGLPKTGMIDHQTVQQMERIVMREIEKLENDRQLQMALKYFEYAF